MFDIGGGELILIVLAIIVLFGPKKIPEIAQMFGKGMREFKKAQAQFTSQIRDLQTEIETSADIKLSDLNIQKPMRVKETDQPITPTLESEIPKPIPIDSHFSEPKKPEEPKNNDLK